MLHVRKKKHEIKKEEEFLSPVYGSLELKSAAPKYKMPDRQMPAYTVYRIVHDELMLDGNSRQNLATFCTTWIEPEVQQLMAECVDYRFNRIVRRYFFLYRYLLSTLTVAGW
jgi:glutamate decarboxylase